MINLAVDPRFIDDLEDDFVVNEDKTLYEFINGDPVKAFYLGCNINKWFDKIDIKQRYLYSKQARHNKDGLEKYQKQIDFWISKFPKEGNEVAIAELAEFVINNMFWEEELDKIKLAFFFGNLMYKNEENS